MQIKEFYDQQTATFSYIVSCENTKKAAIIDPVLDYDQFSGCVSYDCANLLVNHIETNNLDLNWILETHIHADHLTAANYLKKKFPQAKTAIGENANQVIQHWSQTFNINSSKQKFDKLLKNGEKIKIGKLEFEIINAPGHTPSCICYKSNDVIFVGDVIFMPDIGTARCDFEGGSAEQSYESLQKILSFNEETKLYTAHDYPPASRTAQFVSTIKEQKKSNIMIGQSTSRSEFIEKRNARDAKLPVPKLLYPSLQVNICAGELPQKENNEKRYLKIPLKNQQPRPEGN